MLQSASEPMAKADRRGLRLEILRLAWPVVAESLMGTLTQMVDMILVGPLGSVSVAAVGLSTQPLWFLMGPFLGLGSGLGALVSRFVGAKEHDQARAAARQGFWMSTVLSLVMCTLIYLFAPQIIAAMGGEPDVIPEAAAYLRALAPGLMAVFFGNVMGAVPRSAGDTRTPFYIGVGVNVINLGLAWALIYGHFGLPALGLVGAGWATTIARLLGMLALGFVLVRGTKGVSLEPARLLHIDRELILRILRVGIPAAGERLATSAAYVLYSRMVSTLGTVAVAAHYTAVVAENISWMLGMGLTTAAATLVGQALGAGVPERATAAIKESVKIGLVTVLPLIVLFGLFPEPYLSLFSKDPEVIRTAAGALRVGATGEIPMVLSLVYIGALMGAGDSRAIMGISLAGGWVVRLGLTVLLLPVLGMGLAGAWAASVLDWTVRVGLLYLRFRGGRWQHVKV